MMQEKRICPNNILEAREILQLSQKEVALSLSVSAPTVSDWERWVKYPAVDNLKQLADLFETSTDYLLRRTNRTSIGNEASPDWKGELLKELRTNRNETVEYVSEAVGIPSYLYQQFEDSLSEPCLSDLIAIIEHFGTTYEEVLGRHFSLVSGGRISVSDFHVNEEEQHLIELYRQLNAKGKQYIKNQFDIAFNHSDFEQKNGSSAAKDA